MELRQLEAFVAVATELDFGGAADRLHIMRVRTILNWQTRASPTAKPSA